MTDDGPRATAPPGWYPDPSGRPGLRWWDGVTWVNQLPPPQKKRGMSWMAGVLLAVASLILGITIGTSVRNRDAPAPPEDIGKPSALSSADTRDVVKLSGAGELNTAKAPMAGDYTVSWETFGSCYYSADLKTDSGSGETAFTASEPGTGTSNVYGLPAGDYYLGVITGPAPSCGWSATFTPAP